MSELKLLSQGLSPFPVPGSESLPHILLVLDCFPKTLGGGERIALRLAGLLPEQGFRVSLLTFAVHPESSFEAGEAPCPVYLLPLKKTYDLDAFRGALALGRFLRREKVQLVQTFFESSDLWAGLVTRMTSRAKLVWSRRDMGILRQGKHSTAYRLMRNMPDQVFAVSARVADHAVQVDGIPRERVRVIYNGLDLEAPGTEGAPLSRETLSVTTIGNVRRVKGHDLLIEAAALVLAKLPDVHFTVAGDVLDREYFAQLEARIEELGIGDRFRFLGKMTDLSAHLRSADLFVLPSRSEGFSNALIEAMASGLPVVATDVGGNAEAVLDGVNGRIVASENVERFAEAMLEILQDPQQALSFGRVARQTVASKFTTEAMVKEVSDAYRSLLL